LLDQALRFGEQNNALAGVAFAAGIIAKALAVGSLSK